jgi:hypothetical protein
VKIYSTKYALTVGIQHLDAEDCGDGMVKAGGLFNYLHGEGRQWHRTREGAVLKAEAMRNAKIKSLEKSLAKLRALKFQ